MWPDNETDVDLLGFDYLVDSLELVLTDEALYPITVGVLGDWGSGKTSLMAMAGQHLAEDDAYLCVSFSPWRFESYDDVKTALMATVLTAIERRLTQQEAAAAEAGENIDDELWTRRRERLRRLWSRMRRFVPAAAGPLVDLGMGALGAPPVAGQIATGMLDQALNAGDDGGDVVEEPSEEAPLPPGQPAREYTSAADFRADFRALVAEIDGLNAVIVFVDDLDRCLPETIIDTFEAIRLFLHVPKTAYVIAAHPAIVESAVAHRYEGSREGDANLGRDYLEKIVQLPISVPKLSEPEVETYINLLFAQRHLVAEEFVTLRDAVRERREANQLAVAMNYGIARDALGRDPDEQLQKQFALAASIGPTLARGLGGNPRQVKRFLNALTLRLRTAAKRKVTLDDAVLAKLMVLEYLHVREFQRLFEWQLAQDGRSEELVGLEAIARDGADPATVSDGAREWAENAAVQAWASVDPPLADVVLSPYFFFSREGLSPAAPAARLTPEQQELLAALQSRVDATRTGAVDRLAGLDAVTGNPVYEALLAIALREPDSRATRSSLEIAARLPAAVSRFADVLGQIPPRSVPRPLVPQIRTAFKGTIPAELEPVFTEWGNSSVKALQTAVRQAQKANQKAM